MAATIKARRGTKAELDGITLAAGELGFTTNDQKELFIGDGSNNLLVGRCLVGLLSARPTAGEGGRFYFATDNSTLYVDDGDSWETISGGSVSRFDKNAIINGNMVIAQRGTSFVSPSDDDYTLDRWAYRKSGAMVHTVTQDTDVPSNEGFYYSLKLDCTTADNSIGASDWCGVMQRVEGYNFAKFIGQTATLSFWIKAGKTGTMCVAFSNSGSDRSYVTEITINSANTWEYKEINLIFNYSGGTWDYTNGSGLKIYFVLAVGSDFQTVTTDSWISTDDIGTSNQTNFVANADTTCDVYITGIQLELGGEATDFEFLQYQQQLALCKRYYQVLGGISNSLLWQGYATSGVSVSRTVVLPVEMRTTPTGSKNGTWNVTNCGQPVFNNAGPKEFFLQASCSTTGQVAFAANSADDTVELDAEL